MNVFGFPVSRTVLITMGLSSVAQAFVPGLSYYLYAHRIKYYEQAVDIPSCILFRICGVLTKIIALSKRSLALICYNSVFNMSVVKTVITILHYEL